MKKKLCAVLFLTICICVLSGCQCQHKWVDAHCLTPQTCALCQETKGEALGHEAGKAIKTTDIVNATVITRQLCTRCDAEIAANTSTLGSMMDGDHFIFSPEAFLDRIVAVFAAAEGSTVENIYYEYAKPDADSDIEYGDTAAFYRGVKGDVNARLCFAVEFGNIIDADTVNTINIINDKDIPISVIGVRFFMDEISREVLESLVLAIDPTLNHTNIQDLINEFLSQFNTGYTRYDRKNNDVCYILRTITRIGTTVQKEFYVHMYPEDLYNKLIN